jgi:hypothetical protein
VNTRRGKPRSYRLFVEERTNRPGRPLPAPGGDATILFMTHRDLTADQARTIAGKIVPTLAYLGRLTDRMRRRGFAADDPLMVKAAFALEAVRQLRAALHEVEAPPTSSPITGAAQIVPESEGTPSWRRAMGHEGG